MTDVSNAVFDGTDCVMLSGETANGIDPPNACATMAAIAANAELACSYPAVTSFTRDFTAKPFAASEAVGMGVAYAAIDAKAALVVSLCDDPTIVTAIAKYKPCVPVVVVTTNPVVARSTNGLFGIFPCLVPDAAGVLVSAALGAARALDLYRAAEGPVILLDKSLSLHVRNGPGNQGGNLSPTRP
jgi:pyruvate kinase